MGQCINTYFSQPVVCICDPTSLLKGKLFGFFPDDFLAKEP